MHLVHQLVEAEKCGVKLLVYRFTVEALEICDNVDWGRVAESFGIQSAADGLEGGVNNLFENIRKYHLQVFKCLSLFFLEFPFFSV